MRMLRSYLRRQKKLVALLALFSVIFGAVFALYDLPAEAIAYAAALCLLAGLVIFVFAYAAYVRRHRRLRRLLENVRETAFLLPPPSGALEADYQALVRAVTEDRNRVAAAGENRRRELLDYYTLWAHQIKTPVAAMHLLLERSGSGEREALEAELFKIEEYVEMVLSYLRLGSETTDYLLRACLLDEVLRACLRKYARLFILKGLTLDFRETNRTVVTDEKWLGFAVGQVVSNAVKYTPKGGTVRIYGDGNTLAVSDTGIGIRPEDLPRIFEKGFTGYNGREQEKATGIGLYLCHQVVLRLGMEMTVTSRPGAGTLVRFLLPAETPAAE